MLEHDERTPTSITKHEEELGSTQYQPKPSKVLILPLHWPDNDAPQEYKSANIASHRGFSYRWFPWATYQQRLIGEDVIHQYITEWTKKAKGNNQRHGTYRVFTDPSSMGAREIAHGFWSKKDGTPPAGSEWFYNNTRIKPPRALERLQSSGSESTGPDYISSDDDAHDDETENDASTATDEEGTGEDNPAPTSRRPSARDRSMATGKADRSKDKGKGNENSSSGPSPIVSSNNPKRTVLNLKLQAVLEAKKAHSLAESEATSVPRVHRKRKAQTKSEATYRDASGDEDGDDEYVDTRGRRNKRVKV